VKLEAVIPEGSKCKRSAKDDVPRSSIRQATLQERSVSLLTVRGLVAQYVINDMLPLSTVEPFSFRLLISGLSASTSVQLPDRKSLSSYLGKAFELMMKRIKEVLDGVNQVSTIADDWTAHHRSFSGHDNPLD